MRNEKTNDDYEQEATRNIAMPPVWDAGQWYFGNKNRPKVSPQRLFRNILSGCTLLW